MSILGIFLGLILLIILSYKSMSIIWVAPLAALVTAIFGGLNLLDVYTNSYMSGFANYVKNWFPVFMLGAIYGKIMEASGAAKSIAFYLSKIIGYKRAIFAIVIICAILTYGGVSLFVVVFIMYPMGVALFREANITRKLLPGAIALGAFTFTLSAMPGTPQITNLLPIKYFGTSGKAAPTIGIIASIIMLVCGLIWLEFRSKKYKNNGEVFIEPISNNSDTDDNKKLPSWFLSIIPSILIIITFNIFNLDIIIALVLGILVSIILFFNKLTPFSNLTNVVNLGASGATLAMINTAAVVGFGSVVKEVPGFKILTEIMTGIGGNPLISESLAINVLAGVTGSSSGGLAIALEALGSEFIKISESTGIPLEVFHRIASVSAGGLDTLPQCGAVLTLLAVTQMTHKDSYIDIFMCCTVFPILATIVSIILGSFGVV